MTYSVKNANIIAKTHKKLYICVFIIVNIFTQKRQRQQNGGITMKTGKAAAFILAMAICGTSAATGLTQVITSEAYSYSASVSETGKLGENISYELLNTGLLKIKGSGRTDDFEESPFSDPEKITAVIFEADENGGVEYLGKKLFASCSAIYGITLPDTLTEIGEYAFDECSSLREIIIPDSVTCIRQYAFHNCSDLRYAELGDGLEKVGEGSAEFLIFNGCYGLEELSMPSLITSTDNDQDYPKVNGEYVYSRFDIDHTLNPDRGQVCKLFETDSLVTKVTTSVPSLNKYDLKKITVKSGEIIYPYAFIGLNVEIFILPDTLTKISEYSFYKCHSLSEITIPQNVTEVGEYAFNTCPLSKVTLWNKVKSFGNDSFYTTFQQEPDVYFHGTEKEWNKLDTFWAFKAVPVTFINDENYSEENNDHTNHEIISEGSIGENVNYSFLADGCLTIKGNGRMNDFESCPFDFASDIRYIIFDPASEVENIGSNTFLECTSLEKADLPGSLTEIGNSSFKGCCLIKEITVPDSVKCVKESAFENCTGLNKAVLGEGLKYIGEGSVEYDIFKNCTSLNEITMPSLITGYDKDDESGNTVSKYGQVKKLFNSKAIIPETGYAEFSSPAYRLKKIIISSGTEIYPYAFSHMDFSEIVLPDTITKVSENAFSGCESLKSIDISHTVRIEKKAFTDCHKLIRLDLGECIEYIDDNAFSFCNPTYVYYNGTEEKWNDFISERKESLFSPSSMRFAEPSKFLMTVGTDVVSPSVLEARRGCGDVNGDNITDLTDLTCLSMYLLKDYDLTVGGKVYSDITSDGDIDISDLAALKMIIMNG